MTSLSENTTASEPRSCRVDGPATPGTQDFRLSTATTSTTSSTSTSSSQQLPFAPSSPPSTTTSPPIPPRSPLRPSARASLGSSAASSSQTESTDYDGMPLLHSRSFGSISHRLDPPLAATGFVRRPPTPDKPLPLTPQPSNPIPLPLSSGIHGEDVEDDDDDDTLLPSFASESVRSSVTAVMSKRNHALQELLSSERSYASDLALIRDIHIPLASGQPAPFSATLATPPGSSASSSRTLSTASDSSAASSLSLGQPPMTKEDARIIFTNVADIARFADEFSGELEAALGDVLLDGEGEDWVGRLFLAIIPTLETLYKIYITKHPTALEHLNNLPPTPALTAYLAQTRSLASSLSHAWDLPSLLIKPVQRLLKYPLLLATIIEETPDSHSDKANLRLAREKMEEVARGVNEGRRRREVVREVLAGASPPQKGGGDGAGGGGKAKKKTLSVSGVGVGVAASVSLGRMKSLRAAAYRAKEGAEGNAEAESVKQMAENLKRYEAFIGRFAKDTMKWADAVRTLMQSLDEWAKSFGRVIWMDGEPRSEAFDAFLSLIANELVPVCDQSKEGICDVLLPQLTALLDSMIPPLRLLEAMQTLEPLHYGLLNLNVSKSRPPVQLLEASQSYLALRAQLFVELPVYLGLVDRGMATCIGRFALIQQSFYNNVRDRWGDLWDALKVDEEANLGAAETLRVWWGRFAEVEVQIHGLNIVRPLEKKQTTPEKVLKLKPSAKQRMMDEDGVASTVVVSSMLAALDPLNIPHPNPSESTLVISPGPVSAKARSVHSMEYETHVVSISGRKSEESLHSKKSSKSGKSGKSGRRPSFSRVTSMAGSTLVNESILGYGMPGLAALAPSTVKPAYARTKSMPMTAQLAPPPLHKSQSVGRFLDVDEDITPNSSNPSLNSVAGTLQQEDGARGRPSRKPSFRRRLTDSFRNSASADVRHRRSPSLPSPSPSPNQSSFVSSTTTRTSSSSGGRGRMSGGQIPAMYECRVIHPCEPPPGVSYRDLPFFTLRVDDVYEIVQEAGHPSTHRDLPLYVDDGEDCLLLARNEVGDVGWVLASFLLPVD